MLKKLCAAMLLTAVGAVALGQARNPADPNSNPAAQPAPGTGAQPATSQPARPGVTSPQPGATNPAPAQDRNRAASNELQGHIANCLILANQEEVALAKFALQKSQDERVKQFAQKMVDDHRKIGEKLQQYAANVDFDRPSGSASASGSSSGMGSDDERAQGRPQEAGTSPSTMAGHFDHIALVKDLGKQCYESARRELDSKQGAEFDRCFMGMAVGAHMKANDMMTVFQKHSTGPLKEVIADGQRTVAMHLQQAKDLCKKLESKTPAAGE